MPRSNGSFVTSNLAIASNVAYTDRILIVYNAIANGMVGNGSPQTRTIQAGNFINSMSNSISIMTWSNSVTFAPGVNTYNVSLTDCYVFMNTNNQGNCFAILPATAANGKGYILRKTWANTSDTINVSTSSNTCFIDTGNSLIMNVMLEVVMGPDGNFWSVGKL